MAWSLSSASSATPASARGRWGERASSNGDHGRGPRRLCAGSVPGCATLRRGRTRRRAAATPPQRHTPALSPWLPTPFGPQRPTGFHHPLWRWPALSANYRQVWVAIDIGLIAETGLRVSEALNLRFSDVLPEGVLQIQRPKFGKSRLVPLHPTAAAALGRYLGLRRGLPVTDDHLFLSAGNRRIGSSMVEYTFGRMRRLAGIAPARTRPPRIHDLRHTVATRALEQCPTERAAVARHFVALATYLGHTDITHTYWYLEATPELMTGLADAAETLFGRGDV
jgi:integrase